MAHLPARSTMRSFPLTVDPSGSSFSTATVTMQCDRLLAAFMWVAAGMVQVRGEGLDRIAFGWIGARLVSQRQTNAERPALPPP